MAKGVLLGDPRWDDGLYLAIRKMYSSLGCSPRVLRSIQRHTHTHSSAECHRIMLLDELSTTTTTTTKSTPDEQGGDIVQGPSWRRGGVTHTEQSSLRQTLPKRMGCGPYRGTVVRPLGLWNGIRRRAHRDVKR